MRELNFMTIGDKKYFPTILFLIKSLIKYYPYSKIYLYDWGFTDRQELILKSYDKVYLINWKEKIDREKGYEKIPSKYIGYNPPNDLRHKEYLLNQKPVCMLDCSKRINENLFFIDGDAILIDKIDEIFELDFDIGVTIYSKEIIENWRNGGIECSLNSGVIFFKCRSDIIETFIKEWIKIINKTRKIWIEQTALSELIMESNINIYNSVYNKGILKISGKKIKILTLPYTIYNFHEIEKGFDHSKIIHLINRVSKLNEIMIEIKLNYVIPKIMKIFPKFLKKKVFIITSNIDLKFLARYIINPRKFTKIIHISKKFTINWIRKLKNQIGII